MYSDNLDIQYSLFDNQLVNVKQELTLAFKHFLANIVVLHDTLVPNYVGRPTQWTAICSGMVYCLLSNSNVMARYGTWKKEETYQTDTTLSSNNQRCRSSVVCLIVLLFGIWVCF